ncbi:hypothetical protein SLOPH_746 [Spraguea lophii 42_110]|uniref:Uncharacterized protein n=1 Tax=Spraguea lophii (strain 42_110) TaxID=1358809 RepID=S7W4P6_SPRLO|nr:hypothetical protein SLOPH_746 [Spraguea lophii 42_110]
MRNQNLHIDLRSNPLRLGIDVDLQNPELITIEQVNQDILINIRYGEIRIPGFPEDINFDLDVKKIYEELNIPISEKLNLEKIRLCKIDKPGKHTKTKQEIKEMLRNIFDQTDSYKREEKLNFLMRRIETYYCYEDNQGLIQYSPTDYRKRNSIIDYFESIVITTTEMILDKQENVEEAFVRLLDHLDLNIILL